MTLHLRHGADDLCRPDGKPDSPAGHRIGFRHTGDDDSFFLDIFTQCGKADKFKIIIDQPAVNLIGNDINVFFPHHLSQCFQLLAVISCSRWIARVIQDNGPGRRGNRLPQLLRCQQKAIFFPRLDNDRFTANQANAFRIGYPVRRRYNHFVAFVDDGFNQVEQRIFGSTRYQYFRRLVFQPIVLLQSLANSLPQLRDAVIFGVFGEILFNSFDTSLFDIGWCREIRLANAQINDVQSFGLHRLGLGRYFQRRRSTYFCGSF